MKIFFILGLFFQSIACVAQSVPKIVFIRKDGFYFNILPSIKREKLFRNDSLVVKIKNHSVWITDKFGNYSMKPLLSKSDVLTISPQQGNIVFIQLKRVPGFFRNKSHARVMSSDDFKNLYKQKKWLKKELLNKGYPSADALFAK